MTVDDVAIASAMARLSEGHRIIAEGAGATGVAALLSKVIPNLTCQDKIVIVISGGNIDAVSYSNIINFRLLPQPRLLNDAPGDPTPPLRQDRGRGADRNATPPLKVFICYHHADVERATRLFDELLIAGADPWLDKKRLVLGDAWEYEIRKAVEEADAFVACLSTTFNDVGFRQKEIAWALEALKLRPPGRAFIIPFLLEPCEIPQWCRPFHAGNTATETSFTELLQALEKHTGYKFAALDGRRTGH